MTDFVKPTDLEEEHIIDTIRRFSADVDERSQGMHYFNGLTREGIESIDGFMPGYVDTQAWNETPALDEMLETLDEIVSSFGGSYTVHGYAKFDFQARLTVEGFEYQGSERGVGALVYKYRKADEVVIKSRPGEGHESAVYVWWD
jgi:hypothetical protein